MSTGCACVYCDYESMLLLAEDEPMAMKIHRCCECGRNIEKGENYERAVGVSDGSISVFKTCLDCKSVREAFFCDGWGYTVMWSDLWEHLQEVCWDGSAPAAECMTGLTPRALEKVCEKIEQIWEETDDGE